VDDDTDDDTTLGDVTSEIGSLKASVESLSSTVVLLTLLQAASVGLAIYALFFRH
jgi:hypothetical protein